MASETNKVLELPILKHFEKNQITFNPKNWRKGEKGIGMFVGLVLLGTVAWGLYSLFSRSYLPGLDRYWALLQQPFW